MTDASRRSFVRPMRSRNPVLRPRRTDGHGFFFFFPLALNYRRCCSENFRIGGWEILGYGFQDMVFRTWDLNFGAWEILGYGFQDLGSQLWGLGFHTRGFQD
jgi:hypothetical protein